MQDQPTIATLPAPDAAIAGLVEPTEFDVSLLTPGPLASAPDQADGDVPPAGTEAQPAEPAAPAQDPEPEPLSGLTPEQLRQLADLHALMNDPDRLQDAARYLSAAAAQAQPAAASAAEASAPEDLALPGEIDQWTDETADAVRWAHGVIGAMRAEISGLRAELAAVRPVVGDIQTQRQAQALSAQIGRPVSPQDLRAAVQATGIQDPALAYRAWAYDRDLKAAPAAQAAPAPRKPVVPQSAPAELDLTDPRLGLSEIMAATQHRFEGR